MKPINTVLVYLPMRHAHAMELLHKHGITYYLNVRSLKLTRSSFMKKAITSGFCWTPPKCELVQECLLEFFIKLLKLWTLK
ncbi:hypothetical protein O3M35_007340 [Rhynocoris fuscipes]|uniref:Uncharacterized protein n=1 Tax=Rhynocoris fuscipes TaxID=488301 RepID=A0AAW1DES7_9HEMI